MAAAAAGFAAWLGASLILLSDGRRGLAVGAAFATAGLAVLALGGAGLVAAVAIIAGGAVASARRAFAGRAGWAIMPAGSTPRLVTCVAGGLFALWVGAVVMSGDGAALRFGVMTAIALSGARVLWSDDPYVLVTAAAVLAMAIAAGAALAPVSPGVWPYAAGGLIAAGTAFTPIGKPSAA
jgi:hypothetical protein